MVGSPLLILILLASFTLAACRPPVQVPALAGEPHTPQIVEILPSSPGVEPSEASPENSSLPPPIPSPSETLNPAETPDHPQRPKYTLRAVLDYARHHLAVEEQIDYTNRAPESITDLYLVVEPSRYPGVFHLTSLTWGDGEPVAGYAQEAGSLRVPLPEPLATGETLHLAIVYELDLPSPDPAYYGRPVPFGYSARQTNLVDWYPFLPPYLPAGDEALSPGWLAHQAGPFGEHLAYETADFEVDFRLAENPAGLTVAASAPAETDGEWLRYQHPGARNFVLSVSDMYVATTKTVDGVTILGYAFPFDTASGEAAVQATAEALALYNDLFGSYPHPTLSVVEADFLDGMEFDGLYFLSKGFYSSYTGTPSDYLIAIAAHETAHQWWYALVGNDQSLEPWLDEALSTYSERLYYENRYPESLDWWWTYRVNYYDPAGWVDGSIYNPEGYRAYRDAVYLNGAVFLEALREAIGDQAFFAFLKSYTGRYSGAIATGDDFFDLLRQFSQADLTALFDRFFKDR